MKRAPSLFICSTSSVVLLSWGAVAADFAHCPAVRLNEPQLGQELIFESARKQNVGSPNDAPYVNQAAMNEESPAGQALSEIWKREPLGLSSPYVRFESGAVSPHVELPAGDLVLPVADWPCILTLADAVLLSDGFTDHETIVYRIEPDRELVTFVDPRAEENFLLSENSLLDDFGGKWFTEGDYKLFSVPFSTMDRVLKGAVLSYTVDPEALVAIAGKIAPAEPVSHLRYWRDSEFLAGIDLHAELPVDLDYLLDPARDDLTESVAQYLLAITVIEEKNLGETATLDPAIQHALTVLPQSLSHNMNFRVLRDLMLIDEWETAAGFTVEYLNTRGFDIDFAVIGAVVSHLGGDDALAERLREEARAYLAPRLDAMFTGETPEEDHEMLDRADYDVASMQLMRLRYNMLDAW